jgi:hypothetical protein
VEGGSEAATTAGGVRWEREERRPVEGGTGRLEEAASPTEGDAGGGKGEGHSGGREGEWRTQRREEWRERRP